MTSFLRFLITIYQKTLSPDHGFGGIFFPYGACRFYPTCSEYMKGAIEQRGVLRGTARGLLRIARCNPWSAGGIEKP